LVPYYEPAESYGGPVRSISLLCRGLARLGADVTVFTTTADGRKELDVPLGGPVDLGGVSVHYFKRESPRGFFRSPGLAAAARREARRFDLVHSCALWTYVMGVAVRVCQEAGLPRVDSPRGGLMRPCLKHRYWKKWVYLKALGWRQLRSASAIHCTSEQEAEEVTALGLEPPVYVVPNPVDAAPFWETPPRVLLRERLGIPPSARVSVFLGRLHAIKGVDLMLRAFREVAVQRRDAVLIVAGPHDDETGPGAQRLTEHLGLGGQVIFLPETRGAAKNELLAGADLFVLTSRSENFGMAAAEAMAAGVPVLLSDRVGVSRWAARCGAGEAVPLTVRDIARAWLRMLDSPERLQRMGEAARALVQREFAPEVVAARMLDLYREVVSDWKRRMAVSQRARSVSGPVYR